MSWIVQYHLNNRDTIEGSASSGYHDITSIRIPVSVAIDDDELDTDTLGGQNDLRIDSDQFNDLMLIDKAIKEMRAGGLLGDEELSCIDRMSDVNVSKAERYQISKSFSEVCEKIAQFMGGYFTDDGYLDYMSNTYGLDEDQINKLRRYIKSVYKNKVMRKPFNE